MTSMTFNKILVTGASGNVGRSLVKKLTEAGFNVRASCTDPGKLESSAQVEPVKMIYQDASTVESALKGADGLFLIALPMDLDTASKLNPIIDKAKSAGVKYIVLNSALGVDQNDQAPLYAVEKYLMTSGVDYTIVRPNFFMENFSTGFVKPMIDHGGIFIAAGDGKTSFISVQDIARVAVHCFKQTPSGAQYNLTGPEALDHYKVAQIISEVSGKEVTYHAIPEETMLQGARENGLPEGSIQYMAILYNAVRGGYTAGITPDVKNAIGSDPISFKEYAKNNADLWK